MNKQALFILVAAALALPLSAFAGPRPGHSTSPTTAEMPSTGTPVMPTCGEKLDTLVEQLQLPGHLHTVVANSTLLVGSSAYAESCGAASGGFCVNEGSAGLSGSDVVGTSKVGRAASTSRSNLAFRVLQQGGVAKLKWKFAGKQHTGTVDSCVGGIWTATSGTSAVAIHLGDVSPVPE